MKERNGSKENEEEEETTEEPGDVDVSIERRILA